MASPSSAVGPSSSVTHGPGLRPFQRCKDEEVEPEMLCPLCHDALDHPVELAPCGDMFCLACLEAQFSAPQTCASSSVSGSPTLAPSSAMRSGLNVSECPKCAQAVQEERVPTRVFMNLLLNVRVACRECGWEGTREASAQHSCCEAVSEANSALQVAYEMKKREMVTRQRQRTNVTAAAATTAAKSVSGGPPRGESSQNVSQTHALPLPSGATSGRTKSTPSATTVVPAGTSTGGSHSNSGNAVFTRATGPLKGVRRADDTSDSALLRNFQTIEDDPNFSTVRRQRQQNSGGGVVASPMRRDVDTDVVPAPRGAVQTTAFYDYGDMADDLPGTVQTSASIAVATAASPPSSPDDRRSGDRAVAAALERPARAPRAPDASTRASFLAPPAEGSWQRYGMTQAEYDQIMGIFLSFDVDGAGRLNRTQMFQLCVCLNYVSTREDLDYVFDEMDSEGTGFVTLDQFCLWLRRNRPDPEALYGLTPFEYNDSMIQFRVADPSYRGWTDWKGFCQLCLRNRYASSSQEAQQLFERYADHTADNINLHRYFKLLQNLKQQGYAIGGRTPASEREAFANLGDSGRSAGSNLTSPPAPHARRMSADSGTGISRGSVVSGSGDRAVKSGIPRPPPRSSPVTGQVITGGRATHPPADMPRMTSDASIGRLNSTLGASGTSGLSSPLDGSLVASGGRSTNGTTASSVRNRPERFMRGGKRKNDCAVM